VAPGQAWSSDMLETENQSPDSDAGTPDGESTQTGVESDDTHSR
jgi:hypothetical protein